MAEVLVSDILDQVAFRVAESSRITVDTKPVHVQPSISEILVADILEEVVATASRFDLELSLSEPTCPSHPLPCSQDFVFFQAIRKTCPSPWSQTSSQLSPPSSLAASPPPGSPQPDSQGTGGSAASKVASRNMWTSGRTGCGYTSLDSSYDGWAPGTTYSQENLQEDQASSDGVALSPLSQPANTQHQLRTWDQDSCSSQEEVRAVKRSRMESSENAIHDQEIEDEIEGEETPAVPLTFHSKADLVWKLQRAAILPCVEPGAERPGSSTSADSSLLPVIFKDEEIKIEQESQESQSSPDSEKQDHILKEGELDPYQEDMFPPTSKAAASPPPKPRLLLHRAPRLGLSRHYRGEGIHEVSIVAKEE